MSEPVKLRTPEQVAADLCLPKRSLLAVAKKLGTYRKISRFVRFTDGDVLAIVEAMRQCPLSSLDEKAPSTGITGGAPEDRDFAAAQERLTRISRSSSSPKRKTGPGNVVSMDRRR